MGRPKEGLMKVRRFFVFGMTPTISGGNRNSISLSCSLLKKVAFLALGSALLVLFALPAHAQSYTSDPNISDFTTSLTYATLSDFSSGDAGTGAVSAAYPCTTNPPGSYTPTAASVASGLRVFCGTLSTGLDDASDWILASFPSPVSTIVVFPNIDHFGGAYDGYQYKIAGSNDGKTWTLLFDAVTVTGAGEPFTLGTFTGTAPTTVNNVLTPGAGPGGTVGYEAQFTFGTGYKFYAFGASTEGVNSGNPDQELSAVGTLTVTQTFNTDKPTTANFSTAGGENEQTLDLSTATNLTCNGQTGNQCPPITLLTTNTAVSASTAWPQYVNGTPWATSVCAARPANGGTGDLCSLFVNACFGGNVSQSQADDFYCPSATPGDGTITLSDTWDPLTPKPTIASGTTVSLIDFVPSTPGETWTASTGSENPNAVCTNVATPFKCDLSDTLSLVYGDQTTTRGSKPKKGWIVTVFGVPMLTTQWSILTGLPGNPMCPTPTTPLNNYPPSSNDWFNASCQIQYVVTEAAPPPAPNNNFVAAPPASITYGQFPAIVPASTDVSKTNSGGNPWTSSAVSLTTFLQSIGGSGGDGTYILHWSAVDSVGISEKNIQLQTTGTSCPNPVPNVAPSTFPVPCYNTNLFTTTINVDSTKPTIATAGFTPSGSPSGTFGVGEVAYPNYTCADNLSGLSNCGGIPVSCPLVVGPETLTSPTALDTSKAGPHTFNVTATDCAGNVSNTAIVNYNVLPPAFVAIYEGESTDHPKHGTTFTYVAWVLDWSLQNAYDVSFTFQIPIPAGVVAAPGISATVADCAIGSGCSAPPVSGRSCNVAGTGGTYTITCNVGTLASLWTGHGAVAAVSIPIVNSPTVIGTQFGIAATVSSAGNPNPKTTIHDTITVR
jgi:hypothetical protein